MGRSAPVLQSLPLEDLGLEWRPPETVICIAVIPRQPLGSDPPTHLDVHFSFTLLDVAGRTISGELGSTQASLTDGFTPTGRSLPSTDLNRSLVRLGKVASEGGGGRIRTTADVPLGLAKSVERSASGLWHVTVRANLCWEKRKGAFENGPKLDTSFIIPSAEVSSGSVPPTVRLGCLETLQKLSREANDDNEAKLHYDMVLRQLLIEWRLNSRGDEAMWLDYCAMPDVEQARCLLRESLLKPLERSTQQLRNTLRPNPSGSTPVGLWDAWESGQRDLDRWKAMMAPESEFKACCPSNGDIGSALEELLVEFTALVLSGWHALANPVEEPLAKMQTEVGLHPPNMEVLWRCRGESHAALLQWGRFRKRVSMWLEGSDEEVEIANRLSTGVNNLRKTLVVVEDVLVHDLEARVEEMRRILARIQEASNIDNIVWRSESIHTAIEYSRNLLQCWSETEEHSTSFWESLEALGSMLVREARGQLSGKEIWPVWGYGFRVVTSCMHLGKQDDVLVRSVNENFKALLQDLKCCLSELASAALLVLARSLSYPLLFAEEEFGSDFGKIHIGGYEALEMCIKNQPRMVALSCEAGAAGTLGKQLVDLAAQLQTLVLEDIHSTSQGLAMASPEETKEVMDLIEALSTLDFDLTRWNFMRPCVEKMAMGPGAVGEMMKKLLKLADRVRAARDLQDRQHISTFVSYVAVGSTTSETLRRSKAVDVASSHTAEAYRSQQRPAFSRKNSTDSISQRQESKCAAKLWTAAEVVVGSEYHQVFRSGDMDVRTCLVTGLRETIDIGTQVFRLEVAPLLLADRTSKGLTQAFLDTVEHFNPSIQDSAEDTVKQHYGWLPTDTKARKIAVLTMYTVNSLFCDVSKALYENDRQLLWTNAAYIRELRDVFLVGQAHAIVEPFVGGRVVRTLMLEEQALQAFIARYTVGQEVYFPSFTSTFLAYEHKKSGLSETQFTPCSLAHEHENKRDGNITLRIRCGRMGSPKPGQHYPALVKAFSAFPAEDEVLFPPHFFMRIVNVEIDCNSVTVDMETMEAKCVWQSIKDEDWSGFSSWAGLNADLVDTRSHRFSLIGAVAESISRPLRGGEPNPFDVCLQHGADVNEMHDEETPLSIIQKKLLQARGPDRQVYEWWLMFLQSHGASALGAAR